MNTNMQGDFQICISVSLILHVQNSSEKSLSITKLGQSFMIWCCFQYMCSPTHGELFFKYWRHTSRDDIFPRIILKCTYFGESKVNVHLCRYDVLLISSSSHKTNIPKVSYCKMVHFLRHAQPRSVKCLFTNIRKQQNMLKSNLLFEKNTNFLGK